MTPFELALKKDLDIEAQRFANKWLFSWHNINIENRVVEVEDFRGGNFHVGGIVFQGQIQEAYWQAVDRYLIRKVHEIFRRWDEEARTYPHDLRKSSLSGVEILGREFVTRVVRDATDTDRRLRGRGYPDKMPTYNSTGIHSHSNAEIHRLVAAHNAVLERQNVSPPGDSPPMLWRHFEKFYAANRGLIWLVGSFCVGAIALYKLLVG